jgi:RHS repeat-associated protein
VRSYGFDANGRRTSLSAAEHADGNCAGTTTVTTTTSSFDNYDTADRPTLGIGGVGQYVYDAMGRQTTLPGADAPNPTGGDITLGYFDDDLQRTITQNGTSTTFTLDSGGRRLQASTTTGGQTSTLTRHYTDGNDNPAWTVATDPLAASTTTRYAESIGADLGLSLASDGAANLTLATLHGDIVTTVPIAATAATTDPAAGITGWSDYTEYGTPRDPAATAAVGGAAGYGWLGAKQRSTTTETAGLTLMGDRLYNAVTGLFTSPDPEPGGNPTAYTYPCDPINMYDLNGHRWSWKRAAKWAGIASMAVCIVASAGACLGVGMLAAGISTYSSYRSGRRGWALAGTAVWNFGAARYFGAARKSYLVGRHAARATSRGFTRYAGRHAGRSSYRHGVRQGVRKYRHSWQGNWSLHRYRTIRRTAYQGSLGYMAYRGYP